MQPKEYHNNYGRGRNISCRDYDCPNFRKKIGRIRGWTRGRVICPVCHEEGYEHSYTCKVTKNNKMTCKCHLRAKKC